MYPAVQIASVGDDVTFECTVNSVPPFTVMWTSDRANVSKESLLFESRDGMVTLPLTLTNVTDRDFDTYICLAKANSTTFASKPAVLSKLPLCAICMLVNQCNF